MTTINYGGPAFPVPDQDRYEGMTLRDYMAGQALIMIYNVGNKSDFEDMYTNDWARKAYGIADAMIKERERKNEI